MTREETESLREKAEAATPGPWVRDEFNSPITQVIAVENEVVVYHHQHPRQCDIRVVPNFKFIEAASPDVILKLLDGYERRGELLKDLVDILYCYSTGVSFASEEKPGVLLSNIRKELGLKE